MKLSMFQSDYVPVQESIQPYSFSTAGPLTSTNEAPAVALRSYLQGSKALLDAIQASSATPRPILKNTEMESSSKGLAGRAEQPSSLSTDELVVDRS